MEYLTSLFESDTLLGLEKRINDFIRNNKDVKVINVSISTTTVNNEDLVYTGALLYSFN